MVSRRHVFIDRRGDQITITDHGSRNGVFVNQQQIAGSHPLQPDDVIAIGPYELRLSLAALPTGGDSGKTQQIDYVPPSPTWDPVTNLTSELAVAEAGVEPAVPWEQLLRTPGGGRPKSSTTSCWTRLND